MRVGDENFLTEEDVCALRGIALATLRWERAKRQGPAYIRVGRRTFYRESAFLAWMLKRERQPRPSLAAPTAA